MFVAPSAKTYELTDPQNIHPYIFRSASNTTIEGGAGAIIVARWKNVKTVATIAPDYAYGHDAVAAFVATLHKLRPTSRSSISNGRSWGRRISPRSSPRR